MKQRRLGRTDLSVSEIGLGCMGMTGLYGATDETASIETIRRAIDLGVTFFDTAEIYGPYYNEELLGKALRGRRAGVAIATKFGFNVASGFAGGVDGSPANAKRVAEASLRRLETDVIDLYYQHRRDPAVPIDETVGAMKELVEEGKVRHIGLSEVGESTLRRASAVHPIAALQSEFSLWERGVQTLFSTLRELGIGFVSYSPLGRGFLTGNVRTNELAEDDWRKTNARFSGENEAKNREIVDVVRRVATRHDVAPSNVALAWVLAQGDDIVPIPGTKRVTYLEENLRAASLTLTQTDLAELQTLDTLVAGERNTAAGLALMERE